MVIDDPLRLPLLTVEWIFAVVSLELGFIFLLKFAKQEKQLRTSQELGFMSFFFGLSLSWILLIMADYYLSESIVSPFFLWKQGSMHDLFLNLSSILLMFGMLFFTFSMEKHRIYLFKRYLFTICFISLTIVFLITFFINLEITKFLPYVIWPLFLFFLTTYFIDFFKSGMRKEAIMFEILKFIPAFILLAPGFFLSFFLSHLPLEFRLGSSILQLIALGLISYFSIKLPAFAEFGWKETIEELLIMNRAGVCLFHKSFTDKANHLNEILVSGALLSVNIMLEELISAKRTGTSIIKRKEKTVNLFSSTYLTGVIISREQLNSTNYHLKEFIQKIEKIYQNILLDWDGDISIFYPVGAIADEFFS